MVLIISIIIGIVAGIIINAVFSSFEEIRLERRLKGKLEQATEIEHGGAAGAMLVLASKIGSALEKLNIHALSKKAERIRTKFLILGSPYNKVKPYTFIGIQVLSCIGVVLVSVVILDIYNALILAALGLFGFFIPQMIINDRIKAKHKAIFRQLPDLLDLLTLMVEAGLDFNGAFNRIADSEKGTLISEFNIAYQEINLGKPRIQAFGDMARRLDNPHLDTVINSIVNSFKTGGSIAPTLRALSQQFRIERSQLAEKIAGQTPVRLMFPLILFIFPTIFIILFGPIVLSFISGGIW